MRDTFFFTKKSEDIFPKVKRNMSGKGGAKKKKKNNKDDSSLSSSESSNDRAKEKLAQTLKNASNVKSQKQMFLDRF